MNITPLVSVIVPVFNQGEYLNTCIKTIVKQTYNNLEILLIDDGSQDNSPLICDEWKEKDSRIVVIHKKNGGRSDARNTGMSNANGKYICFVDADDWLEPDMIKSMVSTFNQNSSIDSVFCKYNRATKYEEPKDTEEKSDVEFFTRKQVMQSIIERRKFTNYVWSGMYKRQLTATIKFPINKNYEDMYTMLEFIKPCRTIAFIDSSLYNYRINDEGITHKWTLNNFIDYCDASMHEAHLALEINPEIENEVSCKVIFDMLYAWKEALVSNLDNTEYKEILSKLNNNIDNFYKSARLSRTTKLQILVMKHFSIRKNGLINQVMIKIIKRKRGL